jgi:hypothetical protein
MINIIKDISLDISKTKQNKKMKFHDSEVKYAILPRTIKLKKQTTHQTNDEKMNNNNNKVTNVAKE